MADFRRQLWFNIMEDLGPPEGCIVPGWLICIYCIIFPIQGLRALDKASGFDPCRMVWTIHGREFSDYMLMKLACSQERSYRIEVADGILILSGEPKETESERLLREIRRLKLIVKIKNAQIRQAYGYGNDVGSPPWMQ
jgi:hypothetical protein